MVGPLDAVLGPDAAKPFQQRADFLEVIDLERKISLEEGCAFFDMFAAMGGTGSLQRFQVRGLVHDDLVHPRGQGLDLIGELLGNALLKAWSETPRAEQPYALAEAWATLVGGGLLPHEVQPWRHAPPVALLPGNPKDPMTEGIQRVLSAARAWTPHSEEARWLVLDPATSQALPHSIATAGPVSLRCASLVATQDTARTRTALPPRRDASAASGPSGSARPRRRGGRVAPGGAASGRFAGGSSESSPMKHSRTWCAPGLWVALGVLLSTAVAAQPKARPAPAQLPPGTETFPPETARALEARIASSSRDGCSEGSRSAS